MLHRRNVVAALADFFVSLSEPGRRALVALAAEPLPDAGGRVSSLLLKMYDDREADAMILVLTPDTAARFASEIDAGKPDPHPLARSVVEALSLMTEEERRGFGLHAMRILAEKRPRNLADDAAIVRLSDYRKE
ncbi:hypothetical protein [Fulvimarina manganoxydans]|nr:hypothetical protein [Fulvimarina manganoxydans]